MKAAQTDPNRLQLLQNRLEAQIAYNEPPPVRARVSTGRRGRRPRFRFAPPTLTKAEADEKYAKDRKEYAGKGRVFAARQAAADAARQAKKDAERVAMPPPARRKKDPDSEHVDILGVTTYAQSR